MCAVVCAWWCVVGMGRRYEGSVWRCACVSWPLELGRYGLEALAG